MNQIHPHLFTEVNGNLGPWCHYTTQSGLGFLRNLAKKKMFRVCEVTEIMCVLTIYRLISLKTPSTVAFSSTALFLTLIQQMMCVLGGKSLHKNKNSS